MGASGFSKQAPHFVCLGWFSGIMDEDQVGGGWRECM